MKVITGTLNQKEKRRRKRVPIGLDIHNSELE